MSRFAALLLTALPLAAQSAPSPEECRVVANVAEAVSVSHGGKTYRLASAACRDQFLSDPERYAQLYDALAELEAMGTPAVARPASLVPS